MSIQHNLFEDLPFTFETQPNGSIHETDVKPKSKFPFVKGRKVWNEDQPDIAFMPQAVALVVNIISEKMGEPVHWEHVQTMLKSGGFGDRSKGSCVGNLRHACDQGLISALTVKDFTDTKGGWQMFASNEVAERLNHLAHLIVRWIWKSDDIDLHRWTINFAKTIQQKGLCHCYDQEIERLSGYEDVSPPF